MVEWWLLEHEIRRAVAEVRTTLADLIKKNFVVEHQQADGRNRYELNREKEKDIRNWLAATAMNPGQDELLKSRSNTTNLAK